MQRSSSNNVVKGNLIGTDAAGTTMLGNTSTGVGIEAFFLGDLPTGNVIGGSTAADRNVISGSEIGVHLFNGADANTVEGNYVGLNATGTAALPNQTGVEVFFSSKNVIGGAQPNVISGNTTGIRIIESTATDNLVAGNRIGTNPAGTAPLGNDLGVLINGAPANCIGGPLPVFPTASTLCGGGVPGTQTITGNLISGNATYGVQIANDTAANNFVQANKIGTDITGMIADPDSVANSGDELGNRFDGVFLSAGAHDNIIGGTISAKRNIISGNLGDGVIINGAAGNPAKDNSIIGNFIGTNVDGDKPLPNLFRGVHIDQHATGNIIGGGGISRNVISANGADGVIIFGGSTTGNVIKENLIGTDVTGTKADPDGVPNSGDELGNKGNGVYILDAKDNIIGQSAVPTGFFRNTISGNANGIRIEGPTATGNIVEGNLIGTDVTGTNRIKNHENGIFILNAPMNRIGTQTSVMPSNLNFPGNVISGNADSGIRIEGVTATTNFIGGNLIGTKANGREGLANTLHGIEIVGAPKTRIGFSLPGEPPLSGNTISRNFDGIRLDGVDVKETLIGGNFIGTAWQATIPVAPNFEAKPVDQPVLLGNTRGINIRHGSENFIGGLVFHGDGLATQIPGNVIAGNFRGVQITQDAAIFNKVQRNSLFDNTNFGIDLGGDGITPNDDKDVDASPNKLQNYPVLQRFITVTKTPLGALIGKVRGTLNSEPNEEFKVDLYKSPMAHPSGSGEGRTWIAEFEVETDADGNVTFDVPDITFDPDEEYFTATATDLAGNTSEFSAPLVQPDLSVDPFSISAIDVTKEGSRYFYNYDITVRNIGTGKATQARFDILGNGEAIPGAGGLVTLDPGEAITFSDKWDITQHLQDGIRGAAALEITVDADPNNLIDEIDEGNNFRRESRGVDGRPVITQVRKEFAEGVFLQDIELDNTVQVFVDWNGELDHVQIENSDQPRVLVTVNGDEHPQVGATSLIGAIPTEFTFKMGSDLAPGANLIEIQADTRLHGFQSDTEVIQYDQIETVQWIDEALWGVKEIGDVSEKIAEYSATIFFPTAATIQGVFDIPVDRVGLQGGAFGPKIPQFSVNAVLRSDRTSEIDALVKKQGKVADKDFGGIESAITAELKGEFDPNTPRVLGLKKLEGTLGGQVLVKSPKVRLPGIFAWARLQGTVGFTVDFTAILEEDSVTKELTFAPSVLGLAPTSEIGLSTGYGPASAELSFGGTLRGNFSLAQDPCLLLSADATLFIKGKFEFAIFEVSKTLSLTVNIGGCAGGEGEWNLPADSIVTTNVGLIPRYILPGDDPEGEESSNGLPTILYPYAKPSLARHDDGTMTLVYVSEDPTKADGQHLEIFATHYDGTIWSSPEQVTDDTLIDDTPTVTYDANGNAIAVWSRFKNTLIDPANTDPASLLDELEIVYAVRDANTQTWTAPAALTNNAEMDYLPQLQSDAAGNVMAIWLRDPDSDPPIFPDDEVNLVGADYLFATWDGTVWSSPAVAVADVKTNESPQFTFDGTNGVLVWNEDGDEMVATDADREIRAATWDGTNWSAPVMLEGEADGIADVTPRVVSDGSGGFHIAWTKTGVPLGGGAADVTDQLFTAKFTGGNFSTPTVGFETDAIAGTSLVLDTKGNLIAVWQGDSNSGPDIFYAVLDRLTGNWSEPIQFTDDADLEWSLNPFINADGELEILHLSRELGSEPAPSDDGSGAEAEPGDPPLMVPTFVSSQLHTESRLLGQDLSVVALTDEYFYQVNRYAERNALRANLVARAEDWPYGSLWIRQHGTAEHRAMISEWPLPRPRNWLSYVNESETEAELVALRRSCNRGTPYGRPEWTEKTATKLGLEASLRSPGRPKK